MRAHFVQQVQNARNYYGEKNCIADYRIVVLDNSAECGMRCVITARCWKSFNRNASVVYASIWVNDRHSNTHTSGKGQAGGGGYCKLSAAMDEAIKSAGIMLHCCEDGKISNIHGRGEGAIREALKAIAESLGYKQILILN